MSTKEAVQKQRTAFGFNEAVNVEVAEAVQSVDPLDSVLTQEQRDFIRDFKAKVDNDPAVQHTRAVLVQAAVEEERARLGLPTKSH